MLDLGLGAVLDQKCISHIYSCILIFGNRFGLELVAGKVWMMRASDFGFKVWESVEDSGI